MNQWRCSICGYAYTEKTRPKICPHCGASLADFIRCQLDMESAMNRMFIMTPTFDKLWKQMGLDDKDLEALQSSLLQNPEAGDVIPDLGGARKIRVPLPGRGKSGGGRVIYVDVFTVKRTYLLLAYPKNVQENLNPEQKRILRRLIEQIRKEE